ncbi:MAG TPA: carboxylating nicotinate-nucleotide diphosphorylase [Desulfonatronum sp.]|nr:carboxylating nicotinate-nucleotide diphosphorylase [Desulfonatronum sp.]
MHGDTNFQRFFQGRALEYLHRLITLGLEEDGEDLTSNALFARHDRLSAHIKAKQDTLVVGLPIVLLVLDRFPNEVRSRFAVQEGAFVSKGTYVAHFEGQARALLKAERIMLNFLGRLSGVANLTRMFCEKIKNTGVVLLDTRKTTPGLRYPEKYAVAVGGGRNHRVDLAEMLMLKDNHIDRAGGIIPAVSALLRAYDPCLPIEVECRTLEEVRQAASLPIQRIMLDNMNEAQMAEALAVIPQSIESEISGGVTLDSIVRLAALGPTFISSGAVTHSAVSADFSMSMAR